MAEPRLDVINYWTEVKLDIVREYAQAYSQIISGQKRLTLHHVYVDAFAGAGVHISKTTGQLVKGSPLNALSVQPPFKEYHLIDLDKDKTGLLREATLEYDNVNIYNEDCNETLLSKVLPRIRYQDYRRGLCLLDPYGLHLNWEVLRTAGQMESIEVFLNFPLMDMNMNVLWHDPTKVSAHQAERMTSFWGDDSWRQAAYKQQQTLFGPVEVKTSHLAVAQAFQSRLKEVAGFKHVSDPMPMRNSSRAVVYYLFFASQKPVAADIVNDIFAKYRDRGMA